MYNKQLLLQISLDALEYFDIFCQKNGLQYAISFGTELGAIRHGGFIPWDDDIDVDMPIEDYLKLKKIWKKRGNQNTYYLQTKENELFKPTLFYQLRRNGTTWIDPECENVPMHWGIAIIDIFPVYHSPKGKKAKKLQRKLYSFAKKECLYSWENRSAGRISHMIHRRMSLIYLSGVRLISRICKKSGLIFYPDGYPSGKIMEESIMFPAKKVGFENLQLFGHADPDKYLTAQYGDYMTPPPENEREGHPVGIIDLENDFSAYIK